MNLLCILCDLQSEGRGDFGWVHDRSLWPECNQEAMAAAHNLRWSGLRGGWVRIREKTYRVYRWLYDDVYEWIEEEKERDR